jgi:hypothetical protein
MGCRFRTKIVHALEKKEDTTLQIKGFSPFLLVFSQPRSPVHELCFMLYLEKE